MDHCLISVAAVNLFFALITKPDRWLSCLGKAFPLCFAQKGEVAVANLTRDHCVTAKSFIRSTVSRSVCAMGVPRMLKILERVS